jgi:hypothetical protein
MVRLRVISHGVISRLDYLVDEVHFEKGGTEIHMRLKPPATR